MKVRGQASDVALVGRDMIYIYKSCAHCILAYHRTTLGAALHIKNILLISASDDSCGASSAMVSKATWKSTSGT